jgi:hypothetical protein
MLDQWRMERFLIPAHRQAPKVITFLLIQAWGIMHDSMHSLSLKKVENFSM